MQNLIKQSTVQSVMLPASSLSNFTSLLLTCSFAFGFQASSKNGGKTRRYRGMQITSLALMKSLNEHFISPCVPSEFRILPCTSQSRRDTYLETVLGVEFDWFEVLDVFRLEEHITYNCAFLMTLQWIASQDDSL